ncbi:uncharacterized protein Z520_08993 [Fonsecaea multimorphosa CBS 102226]|uniref:KOW domain-containing protein n=1 Tax=Fonsecaea multimorphosa CBS 102226 TaxID=1442371 RepID=A0A0D2IEG8_9EURO|nr:uncharacterized protein Z520_08993 [Fonsecaea multimorphosa CBS 102226]KIX95476.1 hypothetical protein Z520_08993 [Fonsecaea multimorphosa CBS 102226]OAL21007.1 hypothetical protein AYO22_08427 [Fonsecaea multimorphosa]
MQRILRINLQARNQTLKATRRKNYEKLREDWKEYETRLVQTEKVKNAHIKAERRARREDWIMGPLAPKRDVGTKQNFYGTVSNLLYQGPVFPPRVRHGPKSNGWDPVGGEGLEEEQKEWEGFGNEGNIVEGDRVCIVKGKKQGLIGQIGKVKDVSSDAKELRIEGLNMADVEIPESFGEQREKVHFSSLELPIPIADVRLVYRLTDPATGRDRDVIVKHIRGGAPYFQREPNSPLPRHTRYIVGEDVQIPWPEAEAPTYQAFEGDTSRYDVESQTWTPTIYQAPLPSQEIFDDLTEDDKYRRDRAWHEDEYVRMKILEDARAEWFKERKIQGPLAKMAEEKLKTVAQRVEAMKQAGMSEETRKVLLEEMSAARARRRLKTAA